MMEWENKLYQILLKEQEAEAVVDDWVERNIQSDLRLRRAKTKGTRSDRNQGCDVCSEYSGMASVLPNKH